jgi:tocopherol O-methyltransferase
MPAARAAAWGHKEELSEIRISVEFAAGSPLSQKVPAAPGRADINRVNHARFIALCIGFGRGTSSCASDLMGGGPFSQAVCDATLVPAAIPGCGRERTHDEIRFGAPQLRSDPPVIPSLLGMHVGQTTNAHRVRQYYRDNQILYTLFWTERRALSMNVGVWTPGTRTRVEALENQNALIGELLEPTPDDLLLEAGCGTGGTSLWLSCRFGSRVWGITLCERQAAIAARYARLRNAANRVRFAAMDFTCTGFRDRSFSGIFASESVCHAERKELFITEASRLLEPGGRLVVLDAFLTKAQLAEDDRALLDGWCDGWAVPGLATVSEFDAALRDAGFQDVKFRDLTTCIIPSARRLYVWGVVGTPVFRALRALGLASQFHVGHAVACRRVLNLVTKGICRFGVFWSRKPLNAQAD